METTTAHLTATFFANIDDARQAAIAASQEDASRYFWIEDCFGWCVCSASRLQIHTPSDATDFTGNTGTYWRNGKERSFTDAQRIADQNATPTLC
jgi:hypothetical protein